MRLWSRRDRVKVGKRTWWGLNRETASWRLREGLQDEILRVPQIHEARATENSRIHEAAYFKLFFRLLALTSIVILAPCVQQDATFYCPTAL
jgi:hypothetical protein